MDSSESDSDLEFIANLPVRKPRRFQDRTNFLATLNDEEFSRRFRMSKESFNVILEKIRHSIAPTTARYRKKVREKNVGKTNVNLIYFRSNAISPETKLFAALRFFATGSFLISVGDFVGLSEASLSQIVSQVSSRIASLRNDYIYLPRNRNELMSSYRNFYNIGSFPTVFGTIDCTHIKIIGQGGDQGEVFRNRKQFFSINVQSVASADLKFQDIVARWPGSTHDSYIFNHSRLQERLENNEFENGVLLADGGYALKTYLMTPFRNPATENEIRYNRVQILVRNTVERKYGVWKRRFPCLAFGLRCKLETSLAVIIACAVLHNFCIEQNDPLPTCDQETEAAIEATREASNVETLRIANQTANKHRRAVLKRESFVAQISAVNQ